LYFSCSIRRECVGGGGRKYQRKKIMIDILHHAICSFARTQSTHWTVFILPSCTANVCARLKKNEKRKKKKYWNERWEKRGSAVFVSHYIIVYTYLSLDTHSPYLTPSKKKLFKQTEKKSKTWSIFMEIIFKK
jgi:hypothetical protein